MTQYLESENRPEPMCPSRHLATNTICQLPLDHVGDHMHDDHVTVVFWQDHHVIRLDNGDAERFPRLAQLVAMYDAAKRAADDAAEVLQVITDGLKTQTPAAVARG